MVIIIIRQRKKRKKSIIIIIIMASHLLLHHNNHARLVEEAEKEARRQQTERVLAGTGLTPIEASLLGLGVGALWTAGTGEKLLRRTIMAPLLPETMEYACLAGAVAGALAATGLWQARSAARHWDMLAHMVVPWTRL